MTHAINFYTQQKTKIEKFKKFVFVGSNSVNSASNLTKQLHLNPNSSLLSKAEVGSLIAIEEICASIDVTRQLNSLGLKTGTIVNIISKTSNGSVVIAFWDSSIGIGTEIARQIVVTAIDKTL